MSSLSRQAENLYHIKKSSFSRSTIRFWNDFGIYAETILYQAQATALKEIVKRIPLQDVIMRYRRSMNLFEYSKAWRHKLLFKTL